MGIEVYSTDVGHFLNQNAKLKNIKFAAKEAMFELELEKVSKLPKSNVILVQRVADKCWPIVQKVAKDFFAELQKVDKLDDKARAKALDPVMTKLFDELYQQTVLVAIDIFESFAKDKSKYKKYKIKSGLKIGVDCAMLAASAAVMATSSITVAGAAVGAIGMVRSVASIGQQIGNLANDANAIFERVRANIAKLKKQMESPGMKAAKTAKHAATTVLHKVFAVESELVLATVSGVEGDLTLLGNKVLGLKSKQAEAAKKLNELLETQDKLTEKLKTMAALGVLDRDETAKFEKTKAKYEATAPVVSKLIEQIDHLRVKIDFLSKWTIDRLKEIKGFKTKYNANVVKVVGVAADFAIAAASIAGGTWNDPASTLKDLADSSKVVVTSCGIALDSLGLIKDMGLSIKDAVS